MLEKLLSRLKESFNKVLYEDQGTSYLITLFTDNEPKYILCIPKKTEKYIYGKIGRLEYISILNCLDFFYSPDGLYVFAKNIEEFLEKIFIKIKQLG